MTTETTQENTASDQTQLTISDLTAMKSIIDVASSRGAFKPNEMMLVGQTYTKLVGFLESVKQQGESK